jgi:hypothetical protein
MNLIRGVAMVCSDINEGTMMSRKPLSAAVEERLSALSPSERKHFLESVKYNKDMLEELAKM